MDARGRIIRGGVGWEGWGRVERGGEDLWGGRGECIGVERSNGWKGGGIVKGGGLAKGRSVD